jgi:hypothetical protein
MTQTAKLKRSRPTLGVVRWLIREIVGVLFVAVMLFAAAGRLGWVTLKGGSVWPAVIGHGAINGIGGLGLIFSRANPNPLLGPAPTGVIAGMGFALVAVLILISPRASSVALASPIPVEVVGGKTVD